MIRSPYLSAVIAFDRRRWMPVESIRFAVGVAFPLVLSVFFDNPGAGILASLGALYTGLAATSGVYHVRLRTAALSGLFIGSTTAFGTLVGPSAASSLAAVLFVSFLTSLYASANRSSGTISAQATATLCVVIGLQLPPSGFIVNGLLVFGGSVIQLLLLTIIWPMKPSHPEGYAVADAFASLADFVKGLDGSAHGHHVQIPPAQAIQEARLLLSEAEQFQQYREHERLIDALRHAEAIRAALVGFAQANQQFVKLNRLSQVRSHRIRRSLCRCLLTISDRARFGQLTGEPVVLKIPLFETACETEREFINWLGIVGELIEDCCRKGSEERLGAASIEPIEVRAKSLVSALTRLPSARSLRNITLNHAVRYAVVVGAAFAISQRWTQAHSYWLPVTTALVLRQDYGSTFQRGLSRLAGTLAGLCLAVLVIDLVHPPVLVLQILTVGMAWVAFASVQASYAMLTVAVTGYVVFGIAVSGAVIGDVSSMRLVASLVGVLLAVISYIFWPAWNWSEVWETLETAARAQYSYADQVLRERAPSILVKRELEKALAEARTLRIQSESLVESVKMHPFGRRRSRLERAENALLKLEENAAMILVAQTEWNQGCEKFEAQLNLALANAKSLAVSLSTQRTAVEP